MFDLRIGSNLPFKMLSIVKAEQIMKFKDSL